VEVEKGSSLSYKVSHEKRNIHFNKNKTIYTGTVHIDRLKPGRTEMGEHGYKSTNEHS
jgi:hypothetical protein